MQDPIEQDIKLLGATRLYRLVNLDTGKTMGWSETAQPLLEDGAHLTSHPRYSKQFRRLEVRDPDGRSIGRFVA